MAKVSISSIVLLMNDGYSWDLLVTVMLFLMSMGISGRLLQLTVLILYLVLKGSVEW